MTKRARTLLRRALWACAAFNLLWAGVIGFYALKLEGAVAAGLGMFVLLFLGGAAVSFHRASRVAP